MSSAASEADDPYVAMLRGPLLPTAAAAAVTAVVATVVEGSAGLFGSVLASGVTIGSFTTSLLVMSRTAKSAPQSVMAMALLTYVTKIGLLGLLLVLLADATWLSGGAFAVSALVCVAVWLPLEIRAYQRARLFVFSPDPLGGPVSGRAPAVVRAEDDS